MDCWLTRSSVDAAPVFGHIDDQPAEVWPLIKSIDKLPYVAVAVVSELAFRIRVMNDEPQPRASSRCCPLKHGKVTV